MKVISTILIKFRGRDPQDFVYEPDSPSNCAQAVLASHSSAMSWVLRMSRHAADST